MDDRPFSLQPLSTPSHGPKSIAEFIRRVNAEPGGFRGLNAEALRREISARRQNGADGDGDGDLVMTPASSESDSDVAETKDVAAARDDVLRAIAQTHQTAMFALDFVSLLLSKENPAQAVTTFSSGLREMVGIGTLGATMLDAPTELARSRVPDNKLVAMGKRLIDLNKAADTALAASKRLQREIGFETKYWSEVLAVSEAGWRTFRLPHEAHTMGVKFGFSNTAPEFKASGIAPMRRAEDGSVHLQHGKMGGGSQRIRVSILEEGRVVGRSSLPRPRSADAPLQDRVRESRDTIFAQELWHEINREGRLLQDRAVHMEDSAVTFPLDATRMVSVQLVTLGEEDAEGADFRSSDAQQGAMADWLCSALSLMLSNAHRANEQKRAEPSAGRGPAAPYPILKPLISYYKYDQAVQRCAQLLASLVSVLRSAGLASPVTMTEPSLTALPSAAGASPSLTSLLLEPPRVQFDISITPAARLRILLAPAPLTLSGAFFSVSCLPAAQQQEGQQQQEQGPTRQRPNPLASLAPPDASGYHSVESLLGYLCETVPCALAAAYFDLAVAEAAPSHPAAATSSAGANSSEQEGRSESSSAPTWAMDASNQAIVDWDTGGEFGVRFDFGPSPDTGAAGDGRLELRVTGIYLEDAVKKEEQEGEGGGAVTGAGEGERKRKVQKEWCWPGSEEGLPTVVRRVLTQGPGEP